MGIKTGHGICSKNEGEVFNIIHRRDAKVAKERKESHTKARRHGEKESK